jgi:enoyl-CoA hydratase/carnithine racemase
LKLANKFQSLPPRTVGVAKHIINEGQDLSMRASQDLEIDTHAALLGTADIQEAIDSYLEKRRPDFTGE